MIRAARAIVRIGTHPRSDKMFLRSQPVLVARRDIISNGIADGSFRLLVLHRADNGDARYLAVGGAHTSLEIATRRNRNVVSGKRNIFVETRKPPLFFTNVEDAKLGRINALRSLANFKRVKICRINNSCQKCRTVDHILICALILRYLNIRLIL